MKFDDLKIGDVVILAHQTRADSRVLMTVEAIRVDGWLQCIWFNDKNELQRDAFHKSCVRYMRNAGEPKAEAA